MHTPNDMSLLQKNNDLTVQKVAALKLMELLLAVLKLLMANLIDFV